MTTYIRRILPFIIASWIAGAPIALHGASAEGRLESFLGEPKFQMQPISKEGGWLANGVVALDGTVLVTWLQHGQGVRARRSEDGGQTWGEEIVIAEGFQGGGTTVDETTGDILAFVEDRHPPAPLTVYRSKDQGKTWKAQQTVIKPDSKGNIPSMCMAEHGITLRHGEHKGRLLRPARHYAAPVPDVRQWPKHYNSAIYSDDGGATWQASEPFPLNGTGEGAVAELSDGRIYYNSRHHVPVKGENARRRWTAWSDDGGATWKDLAICEVLPDGPQNTDYGLMGGLVRLPVGGRDILLFSNCDSPGRDSRVSEPNSRNHGTVWVSFDGGKTWPLKRLVHEDPFYYSSLAAGRPGTASEGWIYLNFDVHARRPPIRVARFNLSWLLQGEPTGDGSVPALARAERTHEFSDGTVMPAPNDPRMWPAWRDWLTQWRARERESLHYDSLLYDRESFAWVRSNYVCCFAMMCDVTFYDPATHQFTVDKFIEHGRHEFGGYDSIVLWHAFPRIGFDQRNQFDFYRDMPGGLKGLRELSRSFHANGIKVFINYNPWDHGTRREDKRDLDLLVDMVAAIEADGIFLDTMNKGSAEFRKRLDAVRPGVVLESEFALPLASVADHHMSWAQEFKDSAVPGVLRNKWFERRHMQHQTWRDNKGHTDELQMAWMNGSGMLVWENVFGKWMGYNARDRSILRSMTPIQHRYCALFSGEGWTPLLETKANDVYASRWESNGLRLWTLVNRAEEPYDGDLLAVDHKQGTRYFDLITGEETRAQIVQGTALLNGQIRARGIGALLAAPEKAVTRDLEQFLKRQAKIYTRCDWRTDFPGLNEVLKPGTATQQHDKNTLPREMVAIGGGTIRIDVNFHRRACGSYQTAHDRKVTLSAYGIDLAPVTNEQYEKFLRASRYKPRHDKNFLKHWVNGEPPVGKEDHPVVFVDLEDARAYAEWAGKRLPTEEEWQHAAQGPKRLKYPWGNEWNADLCNAANGKDTTSVYEYPKGRSPFGCYDMCGNTWEWTESERTDGRTRFCVVRGGSYFEARGSRWYAPGGEQPCNRAAKFLLMWPGLDRCSTIGFRCVVDMAGEVGEAKVKKEEKTLPALQAGLTTQPGGFDVPAGLSAGATFHLAFVSSTTRDATTPDIAYYNTHVQKAADEAGIGNTIGVTWRVIGSTATVDARDNAMVKAPVYLLNGTKVADDAKDMWDGTLDTAISLQEDGATTYTDSERVFTGSHENGAKSGEPLGGGGFVAGGNPTARNSNSASPDSWTDANRTPPAESSHPFYALSQVLTVVAASKTGGETIAAKQAPRDKPVAATRNNNRLPLNSRIIETGQSTMAAAGAVKKIAEQETTEKGSPAQVLQKKFDKWINERVRQEKEQHRFHQRAHEGKLGEKRGMNIPDGKYTSDKLTFDDTFQAPVDPELWPLWRDWLAQWRKDKRKTLKYDDSYYSDKAFAWVPSNYVSGFVMLWDMTLLDPDEGRYTVEEFVEHGKKEFGGYDSVVLWLAYPILGIGHRNQSDMYRDMPGGLEGMRNLTEAFHEHGIEVLVPFQPWDDGTRQEDKTDAEVLLSITEAINADGIYLDTWYECAPLRPKLDEVRPGLVIDTELPIPIEYVAEHHMSWAQSKPWRGWLFEDSRAPGVLKSKWFERRHVVRPNNRWVQNRVGELQMSWMNGAGTLIWENRFGCWNGWNERARSILRSMIPIQRRYVDLFAGEKWTPLVEHRGNDVFASLWEGNGIKLWTLVNRADEPYGGELLAIRHNQGVRYFDLIKGKEANVKIKENVAHIDGEIDAMGIGGFLAVPEKEVTGNFNEFLKSQAKIFGNKNWDPTLPERKNRLLSPVSRTEKYNKDNLPANMAAIGATTLELRRDFNSGGMPKRFDTLPEELEVALSAYAIDLTPVTNAEYEKFLKASGYKPRQEKNFLKHWVDGTPPAGKADHPVVYVDLDDARAYARWAGKRLPTDAEWQYAAEGPKRLKYPWGNEGNDDLCNDDKNRGTTSVYEYPKGRSPFGCYDMCGNTWEWTESEQTDDGRTRYCLLRGGSYFRAGGSGWYIRGGAQPCNSATKLLLVWPGLDRCSTIGFRCVADMAEK